MKEIKLIAQQNQCSVPRSWNQLKGGNCYGSSFYHSFGTFVKNDLKLFDPDDKISDYPIDMKFVDLITRGCGFDKRDQDSLVRNLPATLMEKMPHSRMIFKDKLARNIAIKILCLYIKFAQSLHANDRPRMTENLKHIIKNFLQVSEFQELYDQCCNTKPRHGIESLTSSQIDLMMSQDSNLYYVRRCERLQRSQENPELDVPEEVPPEKSEADKAEHSEGQDSSEDDEPEHKLTERVLRDKGEGNRQKNKGPGTDLSSINKVRNGADEA